MMENVLTRVVRAIFGGGANITPINPLPVTVVGLTTYTGTATANGAADGSTLVDTGLAVTFTVDDQPIGQTVEILTSATAALVGQQRQIYDYDFTVRELYFDTPFVGGLVPIGTTFKVIKGRPEGGGGGPGPQPEPTTEETLWKLADYDNFDVADVTADTLRWSSEYISAGAADGAADINTTDVSRLYVNVLRAAVAAAEYGVRRLQTITGRCWFSKVDADVNVTNPGPLIGWGGMSVSAGVAWDANNYIRIYKREDNVPADEGITVEWRLAGGAVNTTVFATTQEAVAFKIERNGDIWRCYYSLSMAPRHHWVLLQEIEDPTDAMTDTVSLYLSVYNPEDAALESVTADFDKWELYFTIGDIGAALVTALAVFREQAAVPVNVDATNAGLTNVLLLNVAGTRYIVRSLRLHLAADPVAETVTVSLHELINGALVVVDLFVITTLNYLNNWFSLMDMFGVPHLAGDQLRVTVTATAAGPYAVTGEYSYAIAT